MEEQNRKQKEGAWKCVNAASKLGTCNHTYWIARSTKSCPGYHCGYQNPYAPGCCGYQKL